MGSRHYDNGRELDIGDDFVDLTVEPEGEISDGDLDDDPIFDVSENVAEVLGGLLGTNVQAEDFEAVPLSVTDQFELGAVYRQVNKLLPNEVFKVAERLENDSGSSERLRLVIETSKDETMATLVQESLGKVKPREWRKKREASAFASIFKSTLRSLVVIFHPRQIKQLRSKEA